MNKPITVLHTEWSNGWGGQEMRIIAEMEAMRDLGVVSYLACRKDAKIKEIAKSKGFEVSIFPFNGSFDFKTFNGLRKLITEKNIDIINTHSGKDTWVGGFAAKSTRKIFIRTRHLATPIRRSRTNFINELADLVITTGESVRRAMIENNRIKPEKIISIPTGIDESHFDPARIDRAETRKMLGIKPDEIAIGALGVIRGVKRHTDLVEAARLLLGRYDNLRFFIAGDGPMRKNVKKLIEQYGLENNFTLLGHIEDPASYLASLDIFVNSSRSEGVPQAVIQALMMSRAVIATDVGSTRDLYHENFLLIPALKPELLAETMEQLLINDQRRVELEKTARNPTVEHFSKSAMIQSLFQAYQKVLQ